MKRFTSINTRERFVLFAGFVVLIVAGGYAFVWAPFAKDYTELLGRIKAQQATLLWIQQAETEVKQLRSKSTTKPTFTQSLSIIIDNSLAQNTLLAKVNKRIEPQDAQTVRISFETVSFIELLRWLGELEQLYHIQVNTLNVTRQPLADKIKVRITLQKSLPIIFSSEKLGLLGRVIK